MKNKSIFLYYLPVFFLSSFVALYFQQAWGWPMVDGFPAIERLFNPNFLTNDFYTNTFKDFSARYYLSHFFAWGSDLLNIHYTYFIGYSNLIRLFLTALFLFLFIEAVTNSKKIALIGFYLGAISFYSIPTSVGWRFAHDDMSGNNIAILFNLIAWTCIFKKHFISAMLVLSLAMLIHPVVAIHGIIIGTIAFLSSSSSPFKYLKKLFKTPLVYLASAFLIIAFAANYIPFKQSLVDFSELSADEFVNIIGYFRHPHHYIPSLFGVDKWLFFTGYLATALFMMWYLKNKKISFNYEFPKSIFIYFLFIALIGVIFVEIIPIKSIVSIVPFRAMMIFVPTYLLILGTYLYQKVEAKNYFAFLIMHIPFLATHFLPDRIIMITLFSFGVVFLSDLLNYEFRKINILIKKILKKLPVYYIVNVIFASLFLIALSSFKLDIPNLQNNDVYAWVNQNTAKTDTILVERKAAENQKIRLISDRAVVVSKDFPFLEKHYKQWHERFTTVYGSWDQSKGFVDNMSEEKLKKVCDKYNVSYVLRTKKIKHPTYFQLVYTTSENGKFIYIYYNNT